MEEHEPHQEANDWVSCKCGEIFSNDKGKSNKHNKLSKHLREVNG